MSWNRVPEHVQGVAAGVLTDKQLAAWKLELAGLSLRAIGRHLGIARQTAADRVEAAHTALRRAGVRQDETGTWTLTQEEAA